MGAVNALTIPKEQEENKLARGIAAGEYCAMGEGDVPRAADRIADAVVGRYGTQGVLWAAVGAVLFAALVWGAAHFTAAPGTPVSILWGFVHYTKEGATRGIERPAVNPKIEIQQPASAPNEAISAAPPVQIRVIYAKEGESYEEIIAALIKEYGLRRLEPLEAGRAINETPRGTVFLVSGISVAIYLARPKDWDKIKVGVNPNIKDDQLAFLLHSGTFVLVAFCSQSDAARLTSTGPDRATNIAVSASPWGQMPVLVLIPGERIVGSNYRVINAGQDTPYNVLDLRLN